ncbi:MAG: DUF3301 domain-containing protein [Sulfuritalea sp.]|nr:DUF3301 domain-containing protein [Sulfuritalea sp.]
MDLLDLTGLLVLAAAGWLWLDSLKAREVAVSATRSACDAESLLLLDDTVAINKLSLARNEEGQMTLRRIYGFEYSDTGNDRRPGSIVMLGSQVIVINLNLPITSESNVIRFPWA